MLFKTFDNQERSNVLRSVSAESCGEFASVYIAYHEGDLQPAIDRYKCALIVALGIDAERAIDHIVGLLANGFSRAAMREVVPYLRTGMWYFNVHGHRVYLIPSI